MDLRFISTSPLNVKLILYNDNKLLNSTDAGKTIFLDGLTKCIMHFVSVLTSVLATDDCSLQWFHNFTRLFTGYKLNAGDVLLHTKRICLK